MNPEIAIVRGRSFPWDNRISAEHATIEMGLLSADINHLGDLRFIGETANTRKRAELPADYFARMKSGGMDIIKHLLLPDYSGDPKNSGLCEQS